LKTPALMTRSERARYERFLAAADERIARDREHLGQLRTRFHLAVTIADAVSPRDVAVMYSQVCVRDLRTGRTHIQTVALPPDAEVLAARRPLSSWAGPVLLGAREGDEVQWLNGGMLERWRVEKVLHGPGVAVPPLVRSAQASKADKKQMSANAPMSLQSTERKGRVRWMERHSHPITRTLR
jgi:transcription elongation GreA/GreB family factor